MTEQSVQRRNVLSIAQITRAAGVVMASFALTGLLGIVRQSIIGARFGETTATDAFFAANRVAETLFTLVSGGALGSAFIPVFARFLAQDDTPGAWRLASAVTSLVSVAATVLAILAGLLAQPIVATLLLPHAGPDQQAQTVELMRIMLVTVVIFSVSGLSMAILNAHQRFWAAALAPSMYNLGLIFGALFLAPPFRINGLAFGAILGALLHLGIQLPSLRGLHGTFRPALDVRAPGLGEVLRLMGPRVLGLGIVQINFWVNTLLTSSMVAGSLTALTYAFGLLFVVLGILGQSVGTAVFPTLSALGGQGATDDFRRVLTSALRGVLFMALPAAVGLVVLAQPLVIVIFARGAWTSDNTAMTAWALQCFAVGLPGFALQEVLARAFYALRDTWTPVVIGVLGVILNIVLSLILINVMQSGIGAGPVGGLALANATATTLESAALWLLIGRRSGGLGRDVSGATLRAGAAALVMGVGVYGLTQVLSGARAWIILGVCTLAGLLIYEVLALILGLNEARTIPRALFSRFERVRR